MRIATTGTKNTEGTFLVYHGPYEEIIPRMREDGYEAVELHILDSQEIHRESLWKLLKDHGVTLTSIGTGSVYEARHYNLADRDPQVREAAIEHLRQHMITARPFHALVIIGLIAGRFSDAGSPEDFRENLRDSLHKLDALAEQYEVPLGFEIMNQFESDYLTTIQEGAAYLEQEQFKNIRLHIDTVHMNIEERNIGDAIRSARGKIGHVHVADNNRYYPGHAHYDFRETLKALHEIGYQGALALETNNLPDPRTSAAKSLDYLTRLLADIRNSLGDIPAS